MSEPRRRDRGPYVEFSTGHRAHVDAIRYSAMPAAALAELVHLPVEQFLEELEHWAQGPGLPYGIRVNREEGTIRVLGRDA